MNTSAQPTNTNEKPVLRFSLLGSFRISTDSGEKTYEKAGLAIKLLAYLAFHREERTVEEIFEACWGRKLDIKTDDDRRVLNRQIDFACQEIQKLKVERAHFLAKTQSGYFLRPGSFSTDIADFDASFYRGTNKENTPAERLKSLQAARLLYRNSPLSGINCSWTVEIGQHYSRLIEKVEREIEILQDVQQPSSGSIKYYSKLSDIQPVVVEAIKAAKTEIILYGMNFHMLMPELRKEFIGLLHSGVSIKILLLNPYGKWLYDMAHSSGNIPETLLGEGIATVAQVLEIEELWHKDNSTLLKLDNHGDPLLYLRWFDAMIHGRMYIIDPELDTGRVFFTPYVYGETPTQLPGFECRSGDGPAINYVRNVRNLLRDSENIGPDIIRERLSLHKRTLY